MNTKLKKEYTGFQRYILAEFMSKNELKDLDSKYNQAKIDRINMRIYKTPKQKKQRAIIDFFKLVCSGIRDEYENGASHRSQIVDINTLKTLL